MKPVQMTLVEPCQVKIGDIYVYRVITMKDLTYLIPMEVTELTYTLHKREPGESYSRGTWTATLESLAVNEDIFEEESRSWCRATIYSDIDTSGALMDPRVAPKDTYDEFYKIFTEQNCVTRKYKAIRINSRMLDT